MHRLVNNFNSRNFQVKRINKIREKKCNITLRPRKKEKFKEITIKLLPY